MGGFNKFGQIAAALPAKAGALLDAYQGFFVDAASQLAPVDTGDLQGSGVMEPGDSQYERRIAFTMDYAIHQEFGTVDMPAQPFVRPARDELEPSFVRDAKQVLEP